MPYPVTFTLYLLVPAPISFGEKMWANEGVPQPPGHGPVPPVRSVVVLDEK